MAKNQMQNNTPIDGITKELEKMTPEQLLSLYLYLSQDEIEVDDEFSLYDGDEDV